jgi:CHAT domain-containing protein
VIVSLWNVNDRATAELMSGLYRGMLRSGKSPSAALREAQLEMRNQKRWESPYYWAAFVQHGEWR